jgi:hypothetical protein
MSQVYAVVDSNGILAALPDREAARDFINQTAYRRDDVLEQMLCDVGMMMQDDEYYREVTPGLWVRNEDDFLSLVTLTYINRSK